MTSPAPSAYHERIALRRAAVVFLTRRGQSQAQIAVALRITERTVVRIRRAAGIAQEVPPPFTADELRRADELLDDGCSYNEVARTIGRSATQLKQRFPGRGMPIATGDGPRLAAYQRWAKHHALAHGIAL